MLNATYQNGNLCNQQMWDVVFVLLYRILIICDVTNLPNVHAEMCMQMRIVHALNVEDIGVVF